MDAYGRNVNYNQGRWTISIDVTKHHGLSVLHVSGASNGIQSTTHNVATKALDRERPTDAEMSLAHINQWA